ncbi:MAG: carboxypeptidase regulatory-like domain-containing protein [Planctomycetaceae bacterium]|nr:carboxypeptidase regulatory-like domain-containing protein [Planctomycetaceae bacterium]
MTRSWRRHVGFVFFALLLLIAAITSFLWDDPVELSSNDALNYTEELTATKLPNNQPTGSPISQVAELEIFPAEPEEADEAPKPGSIVRVVDDLGNPVADAMVYARNNGEYMRNKDGTNNLKLLSDANGCASFDCVITGTWVSKDGYDRCEIIDVPDPKDEIVFTLTRLASMDITVLTPSGFPVPYASVFVCDAFPVADETSYARYKFAELFHADSNGIAKIRELPTGVELEASAGNVHQDWQNFQRYGPEGSLPNATKQRGTLEPGEHLELTITTDNEAWAYGRIVTDEGDPCARASIDWYASSPPDSDGSRSLYLVAIVNTNNDGYFSCKFVDKERHNLWIHWMNGEESYVNFKSVDILEDSSVSLINLGTIVLSNPTQGVDGVVYYDGKPLASDYFCLESAHNDEGSHSCQASLSDSGTFSNVTIRCYDQKKIDSYKCEAVIELPSGFRERFDITESVIKGEDIRIDIPAEKLGALIVSLPSYLPEYTLFSYWVAPLDIDGRYLEEQEIYQGPSSTPHLVDGCVPDQEKQIPAGRYLVQCALGDWLSCAEEITVIESRTTPLQPHFLPAAHITFETEMSQFKWSRFTLESVADNPIFRNSQSLLENSDGKIQSISEMTVFTDRRYQIHASRCGKPIGTITIEPLSPGETRIIKPEDFLPVPESE